MKISTKAASILIVFVVGVLGASLALQDWKSRIPSYDALVDIDNAHQILAQHKVPDRGVLTSFASYSTPGAAWLMLPGVAAFNDPRLFEYIGSLAMYLGTLIGVFFLADAYFGRRCAQISVILYGLSELGLEVAGSLSQRYPIHFFYVWMVYFTLLWIRKKDARFAAAAIVTWSTGLYVFLEIAPAIFILPVVWLYYRPPVRVKSLFVSAVLVGAVWYPYLRFEVSRNFVDLKSQILRHRILPETFEQTWCEPNLAPKDWHSPEMARESGAEATPGLSRLARARKFVASRGGLVLATMDSPRNTFVILPLTLIGLAFLVVQGFGLARSDRNDENNLFANRMKWLAGAMILGGIFLNQFTIDKLISSHGSIDPGTAATVRKCEAFLILAGIGLMLLRNKLGPALYRMAEARLADGQRAEEAGVFVISLLIPLMILIYLVEDLGLNRMWWLWPVQSIVLASIVTYWPKRLGLPSTVAPVAAALLILFTAANETVHSRVDAWASTGWAGKTPEELQILDYAANQLKKNGLQHAAVGYDLYVRPWWATFNAADARYKIGADLDLFLKYRYGIVNTSQCAEGTTEKDRFRIVQTQIAANAENTRIDRAADPKFYLIQKFGSYELLQRAAER